LKQDILAFWKFSVFSSFIKARISSKIRFRFGFISVCL